MQFIFSFYFYENQKKYFLEKVPSFFDLSLVGWQFLEMELSIPIVCLN